METPLRPLVLALALGLGSAAIGGVPARAQPKPRAEHPSAGCTPEMARVEGFCIDRWEASMVDAKSGRALSPYFPPQPKTLIRVHHVWELERLSLGDPGAREMPLPDLPSFELDTDFAPKAVSRAGVVPQGYLTYALAKSACETAGKRLCTEDEWVKACRGARQTKFPYGASYIAGKCNVHRAMHPAAVLHGNASIGLSDPRLNLVLESGKDPLLRVTGGTPECKSTWGDGAIYDMVGNLDEWVDDARGTFVGGFYARMTTKGCEAKISSHAASYYDYSTGTRCCADAR